MVDDDRDLCDPLSDLLADEGYAVSRAAFARSPQELGGHSFLEKPFSLDAVQTAVRAALGPRNGAVGSA